MSRQAIVRPSLESLEDRLVMNTTFTVDFRLTSDWGSGFGANVVVTNTGPNALNGWKLEFDFDRNITNIWNASIVQRQGNHYVLKDKGYNATIRVGESIYFGFNGSPGNVRNLPTNWLLNGVPSGGPAPTLPDLAVSDVLIEEGQTARFMVTLSKPATSTISVRYHTASWTANTGMDFADAQGTLTFAAGETSKVISVTTVDDSLVEGDEAFKLVLSQPVGAVLTRDTGIATIKDNDTEPLPPPGGDGGSGGGGSGTPGMGRFNYGEALQKALFFYEANRSGDLPDNYIVRWRGDSAMTDGQDVGLDLTGGYYDAGDHVKFGLPMASSLTTLAWGLIQYKQGYEQSGQLARIRETIRWGTDWLMKAHPSPNLFYAQVGNGSLDHASWSAPEVMKMNRPAYRLDPSKPGSDAAGEAAAALAAASIAFRGVDNAYADRLLRHAKELFSFADTYRGKYSDSIPDARNYYNSYSGYYDELVWSAAWLYRATNDPTYLAKAESLYASHFAGQTMTWTHSWDDKRYGASILLAGLTGKAVYRADAERYLDYWSVGLNGGATRIRYTPGGLAFLDGWGSLRYSSTTAFMALLYADTVRDINNRYHDFALKQMNYILGDNPRQSSYVVGFGNNPPQNPHHRGASGVWDGNVSNPTPNRHILYGALVGGPESPDDFNYHDVRSNYISNEVALDYNAGFTGALARLYQQYGGDPLPNFPLAETPKDEFFVLASVNQQGANFTEIRALLNNRSAWPARGSTNLAFRYYLDLSELFNAGYTAADVRVQSYYSNGATVGPLTVHDATKKIYYVEVKFQGIEIIPGPGTYQREMQLRLGVRDGVPASAWDPTNDWSYQGLQLNRDLLRQSKYIPVYENGIRLSGTLPS